MAKIKLGDRPANFKHNVKFQMLDGSQGSVEVLYKYRTKKEFGEFVDALMESARVTAAAEAAAAVKLAKDLEEQAPSEGDAPTKVEEAKPFSMADLMEKTAGSNAKYIMQVIEGWNLDGELTEANVQAVADVYPAAAAAIMETYRLACTEGRLGN